jgi:hypothetical protein
MGVSVGIAVWPPAGQIRPAYAQGKAFDQAASGHKFVHIAIKRGEVRSYGIIGQK